MYKRKRPQQQTRGAFLSFSLILHGSELYLRLLSGRPPHLRHLLQKLLW